MPDQNRNAYANHGSRKTEKIRRIIETKIFGDTYIHIIRHYQYTRKTYNACYEIQTITDMHSTSAIFFDRAESREYFEEMCAFHAEYSC